MEDITKYFTYAMFFPLIVVLIVSIILIPILLNGDYNIAYSGNIAMYRNGKYTWPAPNFTNISSYFGKRNSPTKGASSYHAGVDILAYQGTEVLAMASGKVTFAGWSSSRGLHGKNKT